MKSKRKKRLLSDVIRLKLLYHYGGVWADSSTWCLRPLDDWLLNNVPQGFFAFHRPDAEHLISSWFLASQRKGTLVKKWLIRTQNEFINPNYDGYYFLPHREFSRAYKSDPEFKYIWDQTPKIDASIPAYGPHLIQHEQMCRDPLTNRAKNAIDAKEIPLFKLTWKKKCKECTSNKCTLNYLYKNG
eukprot:gb/GECH01012796.1/.p1 GENE.gb/GECH01012796.1/~~gb/GECH01012796.1/.p1  ORF type:complete len:186 (+),score=10.53 gb/GECH01012796.1/:1-558(+)